VTHHCTRWRNSDATRHDATHQQLLGEACTTLQVNGFRTIWCVLSVSVLERFGGCGRRNEMRVFSVDRYIFRTKFHTRFTHWNLRGFARFPGDSTEHGSCSVNIERSVLRMRKIVTSSSLSTSCWKKRRRSPDGMVRERIEEVHRCRRVGHGLDSSMDWIGLDWVVSCWQRFITLFLVFGQMTFYIYLHRWYRLYFE